MSMKSYTPAALVALAALVGCGGGSEPAKPAASAAAPKSAAAPAPAAAGEISGTVKLEGAPPAANPVKMTGDAYCAGAGKGRMTEDVAVKDGKLANVFVYLKEGVDLAKAPAADASVTVEFDQKGCWYAPHVVGVRVGQKVKILNSDETMHNVHGMGEGGLGFNQGMSKGAPPFEVTMDTPAIGSKVKCDVHGWMGAWFNVMEHPWFAVSAADGSYTIKSVPDGDYTVHFWQEKLGEVTMPAKVAGGKITVDASFKANKFIPGSGGGGAAPPRRFPRTPTARSSPCPD